MCHTWQESVSRHVPRVKKNSRALDIGMRGISAESSSVQTWPEDRQRSVTCTWKRATTRGPLTKAYFRGERARCSRRCKNACAGFLAMCRPSCVCVMSRRGLLPNGSTCGGRRPEFSSSSPLLPRF